MSPYSGHLGHTRFAFFLPSANTFGCVISWQHELTLLESNARLSSTS
ncbi:hypothetical protein BN1086_04904 [Citrobacter koseri]|uniref:Uncharacterized protein n=1 Tax=Citrobacter koseri TaxID=545 RepID=A0A078LMS8_CITKO|nr:hypothetical protein BN1086_04904 [Citrobacter koseri]